MLHGKKIEQVVHLRTGAGFSGSEMFVQIDGEWYLILRTPPEFDPEKLLWEEDED